MRGIYCSPHRAPAHAWATRTQQDDFSLRSAQAIPVELHHHAAELVGPDLFARGSHHQRGLRTLHARLGGSALGAEWGLTVQQQVLRLEGFVAAGHFAGFQLIDAQAVARAHDEVLLAPILGLPQRLKIIVFKLPAHRNKVADAEAQGVASHLEGGVDDLAGLAAQASLLLCLFGNRQPAGSIVVLERVGRDQVLRRGSTELLLSRPHGRGVVAGQDGVAAGIELLAHLHVPEVLFRAGDSPFFRRVQNRFVTGHCLVPGDGIGKYQGVLGFLVLEEVIDAFFFQQALHEAQIALAVLHAVVALAIGMVLDGSRFNVGEPALGQHRGDDGQGILGWLVEDAAVEGVVEQAERGSELDQVARVQVRGADLGEVGDDAVKEALFASDQLDAHGQRLADHIVGLKARLLREKTKLELVRLAQCLLPLQGLKQEHALGKGPGHRGVAAEEWHGDVYSSL
jgi:hypothetical protein